MSDYLKMSPEELTEEFSAIKKEYESICGMHLSLDMSRGKPSTAQLNLSNDRAPPIWI